MADKSPMLFEARLGMLKPANRVAEEAMLEIRGKVRVEIKGGKANQARRSLYWVLVSIIVPILNQQHGMTLTEDDLHDIMRIKLRMFDEVKLPSGDVHRKLWSTSNRAMNEADRAEYLNRCLAIWATWTGIDPLTLRNEGQLAA